MACDKASLWEYLADFSGQRPIDAVVCPFAGPNGASMGVTVFSIFFVAALGFGLTVRTQHPGPIVVAGLLSAGLFGTTLPGMGATIFWMLMVFGIAAAGLYIYQRAQTSL